MHFSKTLTFDKFVDELEVATGYRFRLVPNCSTCTVQGNVSYCNGEFDVTVYESTTTYSTAITTATFSAGLQTKITNAKTAHTP